MSGEKLFTLYLNDWIVWESHNESNFFLKMRLMIPRYLLHEKNHFWLIFWKKNFFSHKLKKKNFSGEPYELFAWQFFWKNKDTNSVSLHKLEKIGPLEPFLNIFKKWFFFVFLTILINFFEKIIDFFSKKTLWAL